MPSTTRTRRPRTVRSEDAAAYNATKPTQDADDEIVAQAFDILTRRITRGAALHSPADTRRFLTLRLSGLQHEVFGCVYLDNRHRLIEVADLFRGTIDGAAVHPREVLKEALRHNAAAVILYHNHPSGVPEPSHADELITVRLRDALALVDIRVLDHIIVAGALTTSLAERGIL
jgi:DNA repair protein RadC